MAVPASRVAEVLAGLLARTGGRTVRVVDGRTGDVVGTAGDAASGSDGPAAVAALLRDAPRPAAGADDVTLVTDRGVHVLRTGPVAGVFVHLQLDPGADPARARSALADPGLQDAVRRALGAPNPSADPSRRAAPPRQTAPLRQPALAVLATGRARTGDGARAVAALAALSGPDAAPVVLPRRRSGAGVWSIPAARVAGSTTGLPEPLWSGDLRTLRRVADGLRRLG
ncbi:hypothetical protein [Pseudonocardia hydrocarbonoxydans]|uniref:Uncharacterized protein n=1 Tax=Pseudonocardia hydrocarbonoxydans TaxID=76726 RepID=A0A4Y3WFF6_9PSEU|nr:hypothetical protein [Pseudonocardia hydrocarbonoxydans]GEC17727.1 hypothetical protein PHY01_00100 [Pseudonocardia hydrocarbonoxydans]